MRRKWSLVAVGVLALSLVGILPVLAQGPGGNPIYATIDYVNARLDEVWAAIEAIGGGGNGVDFHVPPPEVWNAAAYTTDDGGEITHTLWLYPPDPPMDPNNTCSWNGEIIVDLVSPIAAKVPARAIATYQDEVLGYAVGSCRWIDFHSVTDLPAPGETIEVDVWMFWMGTEKHITIPVTITPPPRPPQCTLTADPTEGTAPLDVHFVAEASDPDGGELTPYWEFGDGAEEPGGLVQDHVYEWPDTYTATFAVHDESGLYATCEAVISVLDPGG
jgi:PKD repeat protein